MATITYDPGDWLGEKCGLNWKIVTGNIAFDSSYPTGGEALDLSAKLPTKVAAVLFDGMGGYVPQYDYANKKVLMYEAGADGAALDEVADTTDLSALTTVRFVAIGY